MRALLVSRLEPATRDGVRVGLAEVVAFQRGLLEPVAADTAVEDHRVGAEPARAERLCRDRVCELGGGRRGLDAEGGGHADTSFPPFAISQVSAGTSW